MAGRTAEQVDRYSKLTTLTVYTNYIRQAFGRHVNHDSGKRASH